MEYLPPSSTHGYAGGEYLLPRTSSREILTVLFRRKWSILSILATTLLGAIVWLFFIREDLYAVSSRVLVKIGREESAPPTVLGGSPLVVGYRSNEVNSEIEILQSAQLLGQVVDELHLDQPGPPPAVPANFLLRAKFYAKRVVSELKDWEDEVLISVGLRERLTPRERVLDVLQKGLSVKAAKDSNVFVAVLATPHRHGAGNVLNKLLDDYLVFRQQLYRGNDHNFFVHEVDKSLAELEAAESQTQAFENQFGINMLTKQEETLLDQISRARLGVRDSEIDRNDARLKVTALEMELKKSDPNFGSIGEFPRESFQLNVVNQLADLQRDREKLRMTELDTGERIQSNRDQFKALSGMLSANLRSTLEQKQAAYHAQAEALRSLEEELKTRHSRWSQWIDMKRHVSDLENTYLTYRKKLSETKANTDMETAEIGNVSIIERPIDPIQAIGIRKTTLLGICLLVGLFVAIAWVAIVEFLDQKVYTSVDLRRCLGVPVFAEIPAGRQL